MKCFVHSLFFISPPPPSSMYVYSIYFMYDVQYIEVSIIIIVNLFLELICDRFDIDVFVIFVIFLYFFELCNLCLYQSPDCFNKEFWLNNPKWMHEWIYIQGRRIGVAEKEKKKKRKTKIILPLCGIFTIFTIIIHITSEKKKRGRNKYVNARVSTHFIDAYTALIKQLIHLTKAVHNHVMRYPSTLPGLQANTRIFGRHIF